MKKSLIALAVLAASGAAMAQSSVTLYGVADVWVGQVKTEINTGATATAAATSTSDKQTKIDSSGVNSSRWGLKGTEDLGGGLKANFVVESGFNIDTGAQADATRLFNRQATVGLSGAFGAVNLGRQTTAYDTLRGATNNTLDAAIFATTASVWGNGIADYSSRADNSIAYSTPDFGGISGAVVLGLGENKTDGLKATKNYSAHIKYANGPVLVGYAHQVENSRNAAVAAVVAPFTPALAIPASNNADIKYNLLAGSYDFGVAKLTGGYNEAKQGNVKDKEYQVGVAVPFGAATVAAGYTHSKSESAAGTNNGRGYSLLGTYDLSKRTRLYAGAFNTETETSNGNNSVKKTVAAAGVRHSF